MKTSAIVLLALLAWLPSGQAQTDDELVELAIAARGAALKITNLVDSEEMNSYGAFISEDGLAIVNLGGIGLDRKPTVTTADGTPLRFGTILGIFPEQELALMKFKYRPKDWLRLAPKEPEVGATIALLPIDADDIRSAGIPPIVGPVMAKRTGMTSTSRVFRFVRILSFVVPLTPEQRQTTSVGCFAVDRRGDLVAFTNGVGSVQSNLVPVAELAGRVEQLVQANETIPFPLPEEQNPSDAAMLDAEYSQYHQAFMRGDQAAVRRHLKELLKRYPDSPPIKSAAATDPTLFDDPMKLFPPPDPMDPPGHQVQQLLARSGVLAARSRDYEGAIRELKAAVALSPDDYPMIRLRLAHLYLFLKRFDEAEPLLQKAYEASSEDPSILGYYRQVLLRLGKTEEAAKLMVRAEELKKIYQLDSTPQANPGSSDGNTPSLRGADARLAELAASKRGASLILTRMAAADLPGVSSFGAFISADGLALVGLLPLGGTETPSVDTADGTPLKFGTVLGIFPGHELALVKFDHRPKVWLQIAAKEPEVDEAIALIPLDGRWPEQSLEAKPVPPVVGKVMAKRSMLTEMLRLSRFIRIISVGAGMSRQQASRFTAGTFAIDRRGDLVGFRFNMGGDRSQLVPQLAPVVSLANQISELAQTGKATPFPLPPASNPLDPAILESDFAHMNDANARGDRDRAQGLYRQLLQRYPASRHLKKRLASLGEFDEPPFGLENCPSPNPDDPAAQQVAQLLSRAATPNPLPRSDFERSVGEYQQAIALSPDDFAIARLKLADLYITMGRNDDAERLLREAYSFYPEAIYFVQKFRLLLIQQGKIEESRELGKKVAELREIFRQP